jgi:hypothetical protein
MKKNQQQIQKRLQELSVAKSELTTGDTSGLVYVRLSPGSVFVVTPRIDALRKVQHEIDDLTELQKS